MVNNSNITYFQEAPRKHSSKSLGQPTIPEEAEELTSETERTKTQPGQGASSVGRKKNIAAGCECSPRGLNEKSTVKSEEKKEKSSNKEKVSRSESMTEKTVQKITKIVRGSSRSETRSKSGRNKSSSPSEGATALDISELKQSDKGTSNNVAQNKHCQKSQSKKKDSTQEKKSSDKSKKPKNATTEKEKSQKK